MAPIYSPKQADVILHAHARVNFLGGAVRSGKTFAACDCLAQKIITLPPGNILLAAKTERTLERNVLTPMRERFGADLIGRVRGDGDLYLFGRKVWAAGANDERSAEKVRGSTLLACYGNEVTTWPESFFQEVQGRLSAPGAWAMFDYNPAGPKHWLKTGYVDRADELGIRLWHFTFDDNIFLDPAYKADLLRKYRPGSVWHKRYILGLWAAAEGAIYDGFNTDVHVIDDDQAPAIVKTWAAVDYGTSGVTVFLLLGRAADGTIYVLAEWTWDAVRQGRQKTDAQYSADLATFLNGNKLLPVYVDPSAASFIVQLSRDGFRRVRRANNAVVDGIRYVSTQLEGSQLYICRSCRELIETLPGYVWDPKAQERGEDAPVKRDDHWADTLRYGVYSPAAPRRGSSKVVRT